MSNNEIPIKEIAHNSFSGDHRKNISLIWFGKPDIWLTWFIFDYEIIYDIDIDNDIDFILILI